jgi:hypothetical protein
MCRRFETLSVPAYTTCEDGRDSVPKHWHIKFKRREITQKKEHNNIVSVWLKADNKRGSWLSKCL